MVRSMLALTKKMVWSASMTTLKNTTTQQCSTKLTKRCGGSDLCSLFLCFAWIICSCNTQILHESLRMSPCLFFLSFQMLKCIQLDEKLKSMDQEITVNPQFVQKVRGGSSSTGVAFSYFGLCVYFW